MHLCLDPKYNLQNLSIHKLYLYVYKFKKKKSYEEQEQKTIIHLTVRNLKKNMVDYVSEIMLILVF